MADYGHPSEAANATCPNAQELLEPLVTCGICMELYVDPVALLNCLHLACGSCARSWLEQSTTCHQCREDVRGMRDSHHTIGVIEAYRAIAPNSSLCRARTEQQISSLREIYRPSQRPILFSHNARSPEVRPASPVRIPESPEFRSAPHPFAPITLLSAGQLGTGQETDTPQIQDASCPFCDPASQYDFVCPEPCTRQPGLVGRNTIPAGHTVCAVCTRFLPVRQDLIHTRCAVCTATTCSEMGLACRRIRAGSGRPGFLTRLGDAGSIIWWTIPLTHAFGHNEYEREIFTQYTAEHNLNARQVFEAVIAFHGPNVPMAAWHGGPFTPSRPAAVGLDDKVCRRCMSDLVEANLFEWWLSKRRETNLPAEVTSRPDCWYGIECRMAHSLSHAEEYNHACRSIAGDHEEAHDHDEPEDGIRYVADSLELNRRFPPFSRSDIIFRDRGNQPVFLCSSVRQTGSRRMTIPGKVTIWYPHDVKVYFGLDGAEIEHTGVVRILKDTRNMRWVRASRGIVPTGCRPVVGGNMQISGTNEQLYHCAVWWQGQRIPGYTSRRIGHAVITWAGEMWYFEDRYELLCWN